MLLGKHLTDCCGLDGTEEEARQCKRQKVAEVIPTHGGQRGYRKTAGHFAKQFHTMHAKTTNEAMAIPPIAERVFCGRRSPRGCWVVSA